MKGKAATRTKNVRTKKLAVPKSAEEIDPASLEEILENPETVNRATRRAAASMKRKQKENKNVTVRR